MGKIFVAFIVLANFCFQSQVSGQPFTLLKDINGGIPYNVIRPSNLTEKDGLLFFNIGSSPARGLWRSNGFAEGTIKIKALSDFEGIGSIVKVDHIMFFNIFNSNTATSELWKSDGTEAGNTRLKDWPAAKNSSDEKYRPHSLVGVNGIIYFVIRNSNDKDELWRSDGTSLGTTLVKTFDQIGDLINVGGLLLFGASENYNANAYYQLWKSDGTTGGTSLVKDVQVNTWLYGKNFIGINSVLFFVGNDGVHGWELWKTDATEGGTTMVKDIEEGDLGTNLDHFAATNGNVYFFASTNANGNALWKSDGTEAGTVLLKDLDENPYGESNNIVSVNETIYFSGYDHATGAELWKTDGTVAGTKIVKNIIPDPDPDYPGSSNPSSLTNVDGELYFAANYSAVWKSNGTPQGTVLLESFKGPAVNVGYEFVKVNGSIFFSGNDDIYGDELRKTDGTPHAAVLVKNIVPTPGSNPQNFVEMGGLVYFTAFHHDGFTPMDWHLYRTDGTFAGTKTGVDGNWDTMELAVHNGELFFPRSGMYSGSELWKSTGDYATAVKDINPNSAGSFLNPGSDPAHFKSVGQFLYFAATENVNGRELWKSDGTEEGTTLVKDINHTGNSNPDNTVNVNGVLFFTADNGTDGIELWKSDGTEGGTVMVKNIRASGGSNPSFLTNVNGVLYFVADDGINGVELWKSNGTEGGTVMVRNINAGANSSNPSFLTNVNGTLYFAADDGVNGIEVWKSNGTGAATLMVKDIYSGSAGSNPNSFINFNGVVLFAANDGISGRELWGSNGTGNGTIMVKDIYPGGFGSSPTALTKVGSNIFFAADDGERGREVWISNGAESATRLMSEIQPGHLGSDPTEIFEYGAKVLVAATHELFGSEVWIADAPADVPNLVASVTANGPISFCSGKSVTLDANKGVGYTYQWKKAGVNIAGATQSSYTINTSGYYSVLVKDAFGLSATSETVIVNVVNPPLATVAAAGPLSFCAGKNVLLKAITGTGYTYQWKKAGVDIGNATSSNYTATTAGAYSVVVTNATGCSSTSSLVSVTINPVPLANVAAASALTFCEGRTVQLKAIAGTGYTYQWKRGAADIAGATSSNYNASTTGIYTVIVTNAGGCSAVSAGLNVVVKPLPAATIIPSGSTTFCSGKNVLLKANTGTNYTYQWIRGAAAIPGANQSNFYATEPGLYTVIVTNSSGCSVTSGAIPISVNPLPVATITPNGPLTFCAGQSVMLRANTGTNYTYQWKKAGVSITDGTQVNYTATASGLYSVVVTNASGCAVTSSTVNVTVNNAPLASVAASGPITFCAGKNVLLKAITGTGYTYQWKKNGVNIPQEITSNYSAASTGAYSVVVSNASGCSTTSSIINVAVTMAPLATVAIAGPTTFCEGSNVLLKAITGTGYIYQWRKNGVNIASQTQSNYTATTTGLYTVLVTNAEGCSTLSGDINITVTPRPASIILATGPLNFPQGGSVTLYVGTAAGNIYQWKKDGVTITGATTESYTATTSGSYTVAITNAGGCQVVSLPAVVTVTQTRPITKGLQEGDNITVYPNPLYRNNYLNIDWSIVGDNAVAVTVYDMAGKKISSQRLLAGDRTVKLKGASGVYLVECRWGLNKWKVFRVVKIE